MGKTIFKRNAFHFGRNDFGRNDIEIKTPQASRGAVSDKFTNSYEENLKNPKQDFESLTLHILTAKVSDTFQKKVRQRNKSMPYSLTTICA